MTTDDEYHRWLAKWLRQALIDAAGSEAAADEEVLHGAPQGSFTYQGAADWISDPLALKVVGIWILLVMDANFSDEDDDGLPASRSLAEVREAILQAKAGDVGAARRRLAEALSNLDP
ncbi:hypothetical protein [Methylocystis heyeri]|uniref:Uncharacterized protein n=1 Tax=Methylocystis heyeri TaxID=391905 RepID=A0A6B8KHY1_9HYPH|nr:hypothetical protein [Methylocystis heyeri]QGM47232.1 hypothetical protein H2LOC_016905 [Methylocystis heyeri]